MVFFQPPSVLPHHGISWNHDPTSEIYEQQQRFRPPSPRSESSPPPAAPLKPSPLLALIIPCYNEEAALNETSKEVRNKLTALKENGAIDPGSFILIVDDGSTDRTWQKITSLTSRTPSCFTA